MTQQEINTYFRDNGYTENPENNFVDPSGRFTFVTGPEQLVMNYPGPPATYEGVIKNNFIADVAMLETWINAVEQDALNPPQL
jgi:hypothetical protein